MYLLSSASPGTAGLVAEAPPYDVTTASAQLGRYAGSPTTSLHENIVKAALDNKRSGIDALD